MILRTNDSMLKEVIQFITTTKFFDINIVKSRIIENDKKGFIRNRLARYYIKLNEKRNLLDNGFGNGNDALGEGIYLFVG